MKSFLTILIAASVMGASASAQASIKECGIITGLKVNSSGVDSVFVNLTTGLESGDPSIVKTKDFRTTALSTSGLITVLTAARVSRALVCLTVEADGMISAVSM